MTTMAPVAKTSTSKRSSKKTSSSKAATKVEAPPAPMAVPEPAAAQAVEATLETEEAHDSEPTLETVVGHYNDIAKAMKELNLVLKRVVAAQAKRIKDLEKAAAKGSGKKRRVANPEAKKNNGFNKPARVTPELAAFLGIPADQMISRTDVSKIVYNYIKEHNLQNPNNRTFINPDDKLKGLLKVPADQDLRYFNIQRYLAPHYIKE